MLNWLYLSQFRNQEQRMNAKRARSPASGELAELRAAVEQLTQHVRCLMQAIDELTTEVQWRNHQRGDPAIPSRRFVLTSMPLDPATRDWHINQVRAEDIPTDPPPTTSARRQTLFD
jgi:hypothetical protein